ncbi:hypothetical protein [Rariglobus hedericola]|uniref:hypothetical protein n=1 Tax=Rariglobus hedericola TaxID=2597822 RepID=UPI001396B08F|nr:hypothetical protein [Rariglobus hedericola]
MNPPTSRRRWAWINGWGIHADVFTATLNACWPRDDHQVFPPDRHALDRLRASQADILAGYSLGSLLLLSAEAWPASVQLVAVAPLLAFDAEAGLGGTTPAATRLNLRCKFDQKPETQLKVFQRMAGLQGLVTDPLPGTPEDLAWGLDALGTLSAHPANTRRARLYAGACDRLLAAHALHAHTDSLHIIADAGHDFRQLLPAVATHE